MVLFQFTRDFDWHTLGKCRLCKLVTWAYRRGHLLKVPPEVATAAEAAGAGRPVPMDEPYA